MNKRTFDVEIDGKKVTLAVVRPAHRVAQEAELAYNKAFREAVEKGLMVRAKLDSVLRQQDLWDDAKQAEYATAQAELFRCEKALAGGGIPLAKAKEFALAMRDCRAKIRALLAVRHDLDRKTAEAYADQARFNHLVVACTVYSDTGKLYYKDVDEYLYGTDDPAALLAAENMGRLYYGVDDDHEQKLPENRFLRQYKFVDEKLRLVDKQGKFIDRDGRRVDEFGRLVNEKGELIDTEGTPLTEDGEYKVEFKPFLDDDGSPVGEERVVGISDVAGEVTPELQAIMDANSASLEVMMAEKNQAVAAG
jgi:hypothetical protein